VKTKWVVKVDIFGVHSISPTLLCLSFCSTNHFHSQPWQYLLRRVKVRDRDSSIFLSSQCLYLLLFVARAPLFFSSLDRRTNMSFYIKILTVTQRCLWHNRPFSCLVRAPSVLVSLCHCYFHLLFVSLFLSHCVSLSLLLLFSASLSLTRRINPPVILSGNPGAHRSEPGQSLSKVTVCGTNLQRWGTPAWPEIHTQTSRPYVPHCSPSKVTELSCKRPGKLTLWRKPLFSFSCVFSCLYKEKGQTWLNLTLSLFLVGHILSSDLNLHILW